MSNPCGSTYDGVPVFAFATTGAELQTVVPRGSYVTISFAARCGAWKSILIQVYAMEPWNPMVPSDASSTASVGFHFKLHARLYLVSRLVVPLLPQSAVAKLRLPVSSMRTRFLHHWDSSKPEDGPRLQDEQRALERCVSHAGTAYASNLCDGSPKHATKYVHVVDYFLFIYSSETCTAREARRTGHKPTPCATGGSVRALPNSQTRHLPKTIRFRCLLCKTAGIWCQV